MLDQENPPTDLRLGDLESSEVLKQVRVFAEDNLFFFAKAVYGYTDITHRVHKGFCDWMQDDGSSKRKLGLLPRGHFKTSINMADCVRRLARNKEEEILLVSESSINSELMLDEIKETLTSNELMQAIFPGLLPKSFGRGNWTSTSITVPRNGVHRMPSLDTAGVTSKIVSRHYSTIKGDDLIADEAMFSPTVMDKAKKFVNRLISLTKNPREDIIQIIGTRWAYDDCYGHLINKFPDYEVFIRKAVVRGLDGPEPFFPERYTMEQFQQIIETDPMQWATQYANDPTDTAVADFRPEWLQWFTIGPDRAIRWTDLDESVYHLELHKLRFYIHVDPSRGEDPADDYSGIIVVGLTPEEQIFIVDALGIRLDAVELVDKLVSLAKVYSPKLVTIENNAYQQSAVRFLEKEAREQNVAIRVEGIPAPSNKSKEARIRGALVPLFKPRNVWVRRGLTDFVEEYLRFGRSADEHLMDALAQGPGVWRFPTSMRTKKRRRLMNKALVRDLGLTGYGC